ncbi:GDSL-type esterase/lipase family protein [Streptomyces sp. WMMC1477]|uniref:GDSL-type esterase/lipase family protein n=1 Tax=Streptomyces sp. WMMC1477 TaxID=3015155 RepID=UPI0022B6FAA6|nr:GDSL-type esterase/lipase family protein [Streptomyces sp. WMMC1477]MCZ7431143.1 GDSL-type esterase/lipase family protein [Streptomyces sp. WMMC1477]
MSGIRSTASTPKPPGRRRRLAAAVLAIPLAFAGLTTLGAGPSAASPGSGPTAIVSMGDSYISGEAGRWKGNSLDNSGSRDGTDRAWTGSSYDKTRVYGETALGGCHRSDSAEVKSATGTAQALINLACSGATTENVFRSSNGGVAYKGEAPQADQLAAVAAAYDVETIALSIGGNDLGFADIITNCATDYIIWWSYCHDDQQEVVDSKIDGVMADVTKAVEEIRAVMSEAGYAASDYEIVLQSYPSPIPRGDENRYAQSGWSRTNTGGCPFWDKDSDWARDSLVPQIADRLHGVATATGTRFLDLRDMLQGREVCARSSSQVTDSQAPSARTSEWARWIDSQSTQGDVQESMHPNYYGQLALGRCLTLVHGSSGDAACRNTPGKGTSGMYLASLS